MFWKEIALRKRPLRRRCPGPWGLQSLTFGAEPRTFCVPWQLFIYLKVLCLYWTTAHSTHASLTSVFFPSTHKRTHFLSHPSLKFIKHHTPGWKGTLHCRMGKLLRLCFSCVFLFSVFLYTYRINISLLHLKHIEGRFVIWSAKSLARTVKHFDHSDHKWNNKCAFRRETAALLAEMCRWGGSTSFKQAPGRCWSRRRREEDPPNHRDHILGITCQFCPWWLLNPAGQPFLPGRKNPRSRWPASPCLLVILMWSDI